MEVSEALEELLVRHQELYAQKPQEIRLSGEIFGKLQQEQNITIQFMGVDIIVY